MKASGAVWSVHWSPDGKMISAAGTIILPIIHQAWTSTEDLVAYVKANLVWRELTRGGARAVRPAGEVIKLIETSPIYGNIYNGWSRS